VPATTQAASGSTAPTVSISYPASNAAVSGTISVSATASDHAGVAKVEFYLDSVLQVTDTSSPYIWNWNTASSSNGSHTLLATAYDAAGNVGTSPTVTVTVSNQATNNPSPTVPTNLTATAISSSQINLSWTASTDANYSPRQISYNVFRNGGQVGTTRPGTVTYQDTALTPGTTYIYAVSAFDPAGNNSNQSASVSATTQGARGDTTPPTVSISSPANNATVSGTISVSAAASDNVGVVKVEFYLDNVLQATDASSPYIWNWNTATSSYGSHTLIATAYDAAGNVGTSPAVVVTVFNRRY
jgi:chitinase